MFLHPITRLVTYPSTPRILRWPRCRPLPRTRRARERGPEVESEASRGRVVGVACGPDHSLAVRESGEVVVFGLNGRLERWGEEGEELDEPVFQVDGRLGLGADVKEALRPTVVPGLRVRLGSGFS